MKKLLVLLGPTGVGKTELSVSLAEYWNCPIISADSRQLYKGLSIGTAAPTENQLSRVPHYMVGTLSVEDYYSASEFESEALKIISQLHETLDVLIVTGGSMMYIDALCKGIDEVPTIDDALRKELYDRFEKEGLEPIRSQLKILDPVFYDQVDLKNYKRVIHALEVCLMSGKPYSSFRTNTVKQRPFEIIKIGLMRDREELYQRINIRVDEMMKDGLLAEAEKFYPLRMNNSLNTVGYKELFKYLDGEWTLDFAVEKIKQNSRIYSRKQMTWFKRDTDITWINLSDTSQNIALQKIIEKVM
ncbi:tRNA (adenosine(37)-N6)-dimethylallyltransferase MiaA [Dysgonomonas sp. GY617]|uniref:tRNA (adenosine(37)-N6)-dimethylallyltransferase MiaA n=1 Tax=Dysgonomonas sp. GY617 TaxID=2780420 RepID=UPI001883459E|nr:tRNA (adenosine(37)-N6)-dimethylallyltransferase MiaA [Dysgonomonas sp. GY617]MBF0575892.1 tRNA (adenosine(37)-N6)-dimethylallyltransferase MiaA [Dysgonomonas sp. GY617]